MNKFSVQGKVGLITGGAGGLGRAFAEELLAQKGKVCLADYNRETGREIEERLQRRYGKDNVFFHQCNVVSESEFEEAIKQTIRKFGRLDILVNNAGIVDEMTDWKRMIDINLVRFNRCAAAPTDPVTRALYVVVVGPLSNMIATHYDDTLNGYFVFCIQTAVVQGTYLGFKYMGHTAGKDEGVIINIASVAGFIPHTPGPVYALTKNGVIGFSRSVGVQSRKMCGVRVNSMCPSFIQTEMIEREGLDVEYVHKLLKTVGIMKPREVAECFVRLSEADVSGATMLVTPRCKEILKLPKTVADVINAYPKL